MKYLTTTALVLTILANAPAFAGGVVLSTEETTDVAPAHDRKIGGLIAGIIIIGALIALSNGSDTCTVEEPQPEPTPDPC